MTSSPIPQKPAPRQQPDHDLYGFTIVETVALINLAAAVAAEFERDPDDPNRSAYLRGRATFTMPIPVHLLALKAAARIAERGETH